MTQIGLINYSVAKNEKLAKKRTKRRLWTSIERIHFGTLEDEPSPEGDWVELCGDGGGEGVRAVLVDW